jgi:hypothetical protein
MISDDGSTPILMDFGSAMKARMHIANNAQAMQQQVPHIFLFVMPGIYYLWHRTSPLKKVLWPTVHQSSSLSRMVLR